MKIYIAVGGDNVGSKLSELVRRDEPDKMIAHLADGVAQEMREFSAKAQQQFNAQTVICAGDSVLLTVEGKETSNVLRLLKEVQFTTYSAGTGKTCSEAALNLQYAKISGKARTWHWQQCKPWLLKLQVENQIFSFFGKYTKGHF